MKTKSNASKETGSYVDFLNITYYIAYYSKLLT